MNFTAVLTFLKSDRARLITWRLYLTAHALLWVGVAISLFLAFLWGHDSDAEGAMAVGALCAGFSVLLKIGRHWLRWLLSPAAPQSSKAPMP